jgi:hypothetical protein
MSGIPGCKIVNSFERYSFKKSPPWHIAQKGQPEKVFSHAQLPRNSEAIAVMVQSAQIQLERATDLGTDHMMLVLQACIMQELWGHGSFHWISVEGQSM